MESHEKVHFVNSNNDLCKKHKKQTDKNMSKEGVLQSHKRRLICSIVIPFLSKLQQQACVYVDKRSWLYPDNSQMICPYLVKRMPVYKHSAFVC